MLAERDLEVTTRESRLPARSRWSRLPAHWPLAVTMLGFPLWWALGLRTIIPMAMALVMADQLLRRRRLALPGGFAIWLLFLAWVAFGVFVLFADAPGAEPGGGPSRLLVYAYRLAWYLTCTVGLLWVANLRESELPSRWLYQLLGFMFVVTTFGGLLGVLAPHLEWTSPVELLLPRGLRSNGLVESIAHPAVADIQNVLGRPEARPKAPFPFANSWGSNLSLYLPFFVVAWFREGPRWQRYAAPVVLLVAAVPTIESLNRGLWVSLVLGVVGLVWLQVRKGRIAPVAITAGLLVVVISAFFLSPLGTVFQERLAHPHSNDRRGELLSRTVASTLEGSPVVGFGSTRDVQGSFASIAGAATPDCNACGVPPLGTQGHLWGVMFSQGMVGALLFVSFFLLALSRCWRCRTTPETLCTFVLVFFLLQILVYDTLGMALLTVMLAIGLVAREQRAAGLPGAANSLERALARLRACLSFLLVMMVLGAAVGAGVAARTPLHHATRVSILLVPSPVYLSTADLADPTVTPPRDVTIDTEAALIISRQSLGRVVRSTAASDLNELRRRIRVTAAPNTRVLTLEVRDKNARRSQIQARRLARSYLQTRRGYLSNRRDQALALLREQLAELRGPIAADSLANAAVTPASVTRQRLEKEVTSILLTPTAAGEVIRTQDPHVVRRQLSVPITTGAALGLAAGALFMAAFPGWRPRRRRRGEP
jgi:hypothetical protein